MTIKVLTGTYASGYTLQSPVTTLSIAASGYVEGTGVSTLATATAAYTVINSGRINSSGDGVYLAAGGSVTNGSTTDPSADIRAGGQGVLAYHGAGTVNNFGAIESGRQAVLLYDGGSVTNGGAADTAALLSGFRGIGIYNASGTVANFATIIGTTASGMFLATGGVVTNGSANDTTALIRGSSFGVDIGGSAGPLGTVANFGTIESGFGFQDAAGVSVGRYAPSTTGSVINGSASDAKALIYGYDGVDIGGAGTVTNFGTIRGTGVAGGSGIYLAARGSSVTNGGASQTGAIIEGFSGVTVGAGYTATVTNFGTISAAGGAAIQFESSTDVLAVEAGSAFLGAVLGDGGTLDLASGVGTLTVLQAGGNMNLTVSGSMTPTPFTNFATLEVGVGASFTLAGAAAIAAGQRLIDAGTLTVSGTVDQTGAVTVGGTTSKAALLTVATGATWDIQNRSNILVGLATGSRIKVNGTLAKSAGSGPSFVGVAVVDVGSITAASGTLDFGGAITGSGAMLVVSGATLEADFTTASSLKMSFGGGTATLALGDPAAFAASIRGFAATDTIDLLDVVATSAALGPGNTLVISDGNTTVATLKLAGNYNRDTFAVTSDGHHGTNVTVTSGEGAAPRSDRVMAAAHLFIATMAGLVAGAGDTAVVTAGWRPDASRSMLAYPRLQQA